MDGDNAAAPAPDADPYAFPPSGSADAGAPSLLLPPARAAAEVVQQEKRRRLVQALHRAADLIDGADILLLHTGAGFSADSGLPVYRDVANLEPMKQRNLKYRDICDPSWLQRDPALFLGFWGNCFNDYRDAIPHYGYSILRKWRDERFHPHTPTAIRLRAEMKRLMREKKRRRRAAKDEWWDEDELHLNRDRGVFHPPSPPPTAAAPVDAAAPPDVTMEGERVWLSSAFSVITGDEVQFAATIDQSSASLRMHTAEGAGVGEQTVTLNAESTTTDIRTHEPSSILHPPATHHSHPHSTHPSPALDEGKTDEVESDAEDEDDSRGLISPSLGAFFSLTSNVDGHFHRAGFEPCEVYELHGNSETWQCSELCTLDTWTPPPHFRFIINPTTLTCTRIAPPSLADLPISSSTSPDDDDDSSIETVHRWTPSSSFLANVPLCPLSHLARPSILMFNDPNFIRDTRQEQLYLLFMHAALNLLDSDPALSVVVLEVGCGTNVPTVRWRSETVWQMVRRRRANKKRRTEDGGETQGGEKEEEGEDGVAEKEGRRGLVRVNVMESGVDVEGKDEDVVSVELTGLVTLQILDRLLQRKQQQRQRKGQSSADPLG